MAFPKVRIVLVETSHPGNIGGAARAMKNMEINELYLVRPERFPDPEATASASGADDLLANAVVCDTLEQALEGCQLVFGTSARLRTLAWPQVDARGCGEMIAERTDVERVAVIFGREHSGLTNAELGRSHFLVHIPVNPEFSSESATKAGHGMDGSGHAYDEVAVGDTFGRSITITETHLVLGAGLIGDFNPHHVDDAYAKSSRFGTRILHGMITSALMGGRWACTSTAPRSRTSSTRHASRPRCGPVTRSRRHGRSSIGMTSRSTVAASSCCSACAQSGRHGRRGSGREDARSRARVSGAPDPLQSTQRPARVVAHSPTRSGPR